MKKENLKTTSVQEELVKDRRVLRTNIRVAFELKQEGTRKEYNAMGKQIEQYFEKELDSRWTGGTLFDYKIDGDEITPKIAAKALREVAEWATKHAEIMDPTEELTTGSEEVEE